jgi:hypothetical protein
MSSRNGSLKFYSLYTACFWIFDLTLPFEGEVLNDNENLTFIKDQVKVEVGPGLIRENLHFNLFHLGIDIWQIHTIQLHFFCFVKYHLYILIKDIFEKIFVDSELHE